MKVTKIEMGECNGCKNSCRLINGACSVCRIKFGKNCGPVMARVRTDSKFALLCYRALNKDNDRDRFVQMFGDPRQSETTSAPILKLVLAT